MSELGGIEAGRPRRIALSALRNADVESLSRTAPPSQQGVRALSLVISFREISAPRDLVECKNAPPGGLSPAGRLTYPGYCRTIWNTATLPLASFPTTRSGCLLGESTAGTKTIPSGARSPVAPLRVFA